MISVWQLRISVWHTGFHIPGLKTRQDSPAYLNPTSNRVHSSQTSSQTFSEIAPKMVLHDRAGGQYTVLANNHSNARSECVHDPPVTWNRWTYVGRWPRDKLLGIKPGHRAKLIVMNYSLFGSYINPLFRKLALLIQEKEQDQSVEVPFSCPKIRTLWYTQSHLLKIQGVSHCNGPLWNQWEVRLRHPVASMDATINLVDEADLRTFLRPPANIPIRNFTPSCSWDDEADWNSSTSGVTSTLLLFCVHN